MVIELSNEFGKIKINEKVIEQIAGKVLLDFKSIVQPRNLGDGIRVNKIDEKITVDVAVIINYGVNIKDLTRELMTAVKETIEKQTDCKIDTVNIFVKGVAVNDK